MLEEKTGLLGAGDLDGHPADRVDQVGRTFCLHRVASVARSGIAPYIEGW